MRNKRRIVMFNRVSADGFFGADDGNLNWAVPDDAIDKEAAANIPAYDTILFGRKTYEQFEAFWPHALDNAQATDPHDSGRRFPEMRAMAVMLNQNAKIVFSRTLKTATWNNSRVVSKLDPEEIESLKKQPGKDMIIFGSGSIVSQLTEHRLIDEYHFIVNPIFLGSGQSIFTGAAKISRLKLLETKAYPAGNVLLRYGRST